MPYVDSGGVPIYYETRGEGPPFILIHAISAGAGMWQPQVNHFAATHQVITFDVRGVGRSGPIRGGHMLKLETPTSGQMCFGCRRFWLRYWGPS